MIQSGDQSVVHASCAKTISHCAKAANFGAGREGSFRTGKQRSNSVNTTISAADTHPRQRAPILDTEISYVDKGHGDPIIFLHGNPSSSYLWRNIIPYVEQYGRCLAPDLAGMGQSGNSPTHAYRFLDHARYLDAWFDALHLNSNIVWSCTIGAPRWAFIGPFVTAIRSKRLSIWRLSFSRGDGRTSRMAETRCSGLFDQRRVSTW
jgi:hypothetical protein